MIPENTTKDLDYSLEHVYTPHRGEANTKDRSEYLQQQDQSSRTTTVYIQSNRPYTSSVAFSATFGFPILNSRPTYALVLLLLSIGHDMPLLTIYQDRLVYFIPIVSAYRTFLLPVRRPYSFALQTTCRNILSSDKTYTMPPHALARSRSLSRARAEDTIVEPRCFPVHTPNIIQREDPRETPAMYRKGSAFLLPFRRTNNYGQGVKSMFYWSARRIQSWKPHVFSNVQHNLLSRPGTLALHGKSSAFFRPFAAQRTPSTKNEFLQPPPGGSQWRSASVSHVENTNGSHARACRGGGRNNGGWAGKGEQKRCDWREGKPHRANMLHIYVAGKSREKARHAN